MCKPGLQNWVNAMAYKYYEVDQSGGEWDKLRLGKITASRFKDVVAIGVKGNYLKPRADYKRELVAERIIGVLGKKDVFVTQAMQWGNMNEEIARTVYQLRTGNKVTPSGIAVLLDDNGKELPIAASSDGRITLKGASEARGNLEIKSLEPHNHLYNVIKEFEKTQTMPDDYKAQVQGQMLIQDDLEFTHFVGHDSRMPAGLDLMACLVERDDDYIEWLRSELFTFAAEVDAEFNSFLKYLPVCERTCKTCGLVFTDKLAICPECRMNSTTVNKVLAPAELKLSELKDLPGLAA